MHNLGQMRSWRGHVNHTLFLCSCHLWNHHFSFTCRIWIKCKLRNGTERDWPCSCAVKSSYCCIRLGRHVPTRCKDLKEFCSWKVLATQFLTNSVPAANSSVFKRTKKVLVCNCQPVIDIVMITDNCHFCVVTRPRLSLQIAGTVDQVWWVV